MGGVTSSVALECIAYEGVYAEIVLQMADERRR